MTSTKLVACVRCEKPCAHPFTPLPVMASRTRPIPRGLRNTTTVSGRKKSTKKRAAVAPGKLSGRPRSPCAPRRTSLSEDAGFTKLPAPLLDRGPAVALAYTFLGDAVWELYARQHMILRRAAEVTKGGTKGVAMRPQEATKRGWCSSVAMHGHLVRLLEGGALADEELDILRWGRDYGHESRAGHKSKSHREASALEALVAYWYLHDPDRLHEVFETLGMTVCAAPLRGLRSDAVEAAAVAAMNGLQSGEARDENEGQEHSIISKSAPEADGQQKTRDC